MNYESYCRLLVDMSDDISYITDIDTYEILFMTKAAMRFFDLKSDDEYRGKKCYQILQGLDSPCGFCSDSRVCGNQFHKWSRYVEKLGKWMMFEDFQTVIEGKLCRVGMAVDITAEKKRSSRLSDSVVMETILLQCIRTLSMTDDLDSAVSAFLETLGRFYRADRTYILEVDEGGESFSDTFEWCRSGISSEKGKLQNVPMQVLDALGNAFGNKDNIYIASVDQIAKDTQLYSFLCAQQVQELMVMPLSIEDRISGFIGVDNPRTNLDRRGILQATSDFVVEELKKRRMLSRLEYISYTDMLTGTYNRNRYIDDLSSFKKNPPAAFGAMVIDVNGLKRINDLYGHKYGDQLIERAAGVLINSFKEPVYRLGGDEFVILLPDISEDEINERAHALKQRFSEESDCDVAIGFSWDKGKYNIDKVIFLADEKMYAHKKYYYTGILREEMLIESGAAAKVRKEIDDGIFQVHYQPSVDMESGLIVSVEALVRKRGNDGGLMMPKRFVHFYEAHGMLPYVDIFVLKQAVECYARFGLKEKNIPISVNISQDTMILPDFIRQLEIGCARYGVPPEHLKLEVAHKSINLRNEKLIKTMQAVRAAGFKLVLDSFGEEGASFEILAEMEFDEIKYSKSMVTSIDQKKQNRIMVSNILRLCYEIQDAVQVVKGIENSRQVEFFKENHCTVGQGFYYHRPMEREMLKELLEKQG